METKCPLADKWTKMLNTHTHTHTHTRARARICREASHMPLVVKKSTCQCRRHKRCGFDPWVVKTPGEGNGNPLQYSRPGNPMNGRTWWATVHGVTKSRTGLSNWACVHAYIYIYIYIYRLLLSHKKEWNSAIFSNMDGPRDYYTK